MSKLKCRVSDYLYGSQNLVTDRLGFYQEETTSATGGDGGGLRAGGIEPISWQLSQRALQ